MKKITVSTKGFSALAPDAPPTWRQKDEDGRERMYVRGYASTFDRVDRHGEIIGRGCWDDVPADGNGIRFMHGHDANGQAVGVFRLFEVTERGLYFEAEMLPTTLGQDLFIQLEARALDTFSVGFIVKGTREVTARELRRRGVIVPEHIKDHIDVVEYTAAELVEVSTVLFPSNDGARVGEKKMSIRKKSKTIKRPRALVAQKDAGAVGSGVTWAYDDGEPGYGVVVEVYTGEDVADDDGDVFEAVDGDPIYKIHVYFTEDGETYAPTDPEVFVIAYRSQVSAAEIPGLAEAEPAEETTIENESKGNPLSGFFAKMGV